MPLTITQTPQGATGWAAVQQNNLTNIKTFVDALETDLNGFPDELKNLTQAEIQQLENIAATTISATQWGYLGAQTGLSGMTNRGDPAANDFALGDLTADGTWRDLDLSTIVPAGAKTISLYTELIGPGVNWDILFRKNGNANTIARASLFTPANNVWTSGDFTISCDTDRKIEYRLSNHAWSFVFITVKGWWF